jgi:hypothetical protein
MASRSARSVSALSAFSAAGRFTVNVLSAPSWVIRMQELSVMAPPLVSHVAVNNEASPLDNRVEGLVTY